ncbi:MAG TPA: hypothetical protein VGK49_07840, partial [Ilumatobacteraceae bacterium]
KMVVGDVARYRYWPLDRNANFVPDGRLDRTSLPGDTPDNYGSDLRILPNLDTTGTDDGPPNLTAQVGSAADPGTFVAERFTVRDTDPRPVPGGDRLGFETSLLGNVPVGRRVQKMLSSYVAFTRPGTHRVTTENGIFGDQQALDAHNVGAQHVFAGGQTLFYDVTVSDVTVTVAGRTVDLSTPGTSDRVTMVPFQSATVAVTPNTSRSYALIVPDPAGSLLRAEADTRLAAQAVAGGPVPVEVSRFYACTNGSYPPGGLAFAGMHLSRDVHIPVRRFSVDVVTTLPLRATADPAAAPITTVARDTDAFVLVPAPIARALEVTTVAGAPPAAGAADPITRIDTPAAASGFVGVSGAVFRVRFPASAPTGAVVLTVRVGTGATTADLTCSFDLT